MAQILLKILTTKLKPQEKVGYFCDSKKQGSLQAVGAKAPPLWMFFNIGNCDICQAAQETHEPTASKLSYF